jgi:hypothetical protein
MDLSVSYGDLTVTFSLSGLVVAALIARIYKKR